MTKLLPHHRSVLEALEGAPKWDDEYLYRSFATICDLTEMGRTEVRRIVRHLARKGLTEYGKGLWSEDGEPRGAGYRITDAGVRELEAA